MHEHVARFLYYLAIHLLYASIAGLAAWGLTSVRAGSATAKYWIWVATSLNFLFPLGAVVDELWASHLSWASPLGFIGGPIYTLTGSPVAGVVAAVWLVGATAMLARLGLRIRAERRDDRSLTDDDVRPGFLARGIPVRFGSCREAPVVHGLLRPRISLPDGIERLLSERELHAVLLHETTHARRRDNLIRLLHEVCLCGLWFHPLVWLTGARLAMYRELSCDESVIDGAHGEELLSALAKLVNPEKSFVLQATATSFLRHRLIRLAAPARPMTAATSAILMALFAGVLLWAVVGTVAHTACCFVARS